MDAIRYHVLLLCCVASIGSFIPDDEPQREECRELEKKILKEYQCCIQEGEHIFSADVTEWFPKLPVLTEAPVSHLSLRTFADHYCRQEVHNLTCMNKKDRRIKTLGKDCIKNSTAYMVQTDATIQSRRVHYLCENDAAYLKEIYIHRGNICLQGKKSFLCTKHIIKENFNLEASKYEPNCRKFRQLVDCLRDEWKNQCSSRATNYLIGLLRNTYEMFHCPYQPRLDSPTAAPRNSASTTPVSLLSRLLIFIVFGWANHSQMPVF